MFIENELVVHNSLLGEFEKKEWFHTGDIVEFVNEEKTEFKIISRKSDTINIGGNRINLLEVEQETIHCGHFVFYWLSTPPI